LTARLHKGQPRFLWKSNDVASCFPLETNNKTLKTLPDHTSPQKILPDHT
jgi:hypothetical protein